jgi:hypothetical protein
MAAHISINPSASSSKARQTAARQVRLALNLYAGKTKPTLKVLAALGGFPVARLYQARFRRRHKGGNGKHNGSTQSVPNGNGAPASLADMLERASAEERAAAAAKFGVARVWDEMVIPVMDAEQRNQHPAK